MAKLNSEIAAIHQSLADEYLENCPDASEFEAYTATYDLAFMIQLDNLAARIISLRTETNLNG